MLFYVQVSTLFIMLFSIMSLSMSMNVDTRLRILLFMSSLVYTALSILCLLVQSFNIIRYGSLIDKMNRTTIIIPIDLWLSFFLFFLLFTSFKFVLRLRWKGNVGFSLFFEWMMWRDMMSILSFVLYSASPTEGLKQWW